jgi:hypothetical protein
MKIYKYTPHIDDFLKSSSLRVSPAYELNDPFEVVLSEKTIKKRDRLLNKLANRMGLNIELGRQLRQLRENAAKLFGSPEIRAGIVSFSTNSNHPLMWSHYTNGHKGGVLEFEVEPINIGQDNKCSMLSNNKKYYFGYVSYSNKRDAHVDLENLNRVIINCIFSKSRIWEYESEIRIYMDYLNVDYYLLPLSTLCNYQNRWHENECTFYYFFDRTLKKYLELSVFNDPIENKKHYCRINDVDIITFVKRIFYGNVSIENYSDEMLKLKFPDEDGYPDINRLLNLSKIIDPNFLIHPMISIHPEALTGLYLGIRYSGNFDKWISNFPNLNGNIFRASLDPDTYEVNYTKYNLS